MKHKIKLLVTLIAFSFYLQGCSTTQSSLATGAGIGGLAGAGMGAIADLYVEA